MKFSKTEKPKIMKEAKEKGVKVTLDLRGVYPTTYYKWKKCYDLFREEGAGFKGLKEIKKEIKNLDRISNQHTLHR